MSFGFWLFLATVWVGIIGTGIAAWNKSFQHLRDPSRRSEVPVAFERAAFLPEGQRLRRRALICWALGLSILALYYAVVAPRMG
jgi:hypothetical protein